MEIIIHEFEEHLIKQNKLAFYDITDHIKFSMFQQQNGFHIFHYDFMNIVKLKSWIRSKTYKIELWNVKHEFSYLMGGLISIPANKK